MTEIDIKNFDRVLKLPKVVVKVGASWCGPCRMIAPVVDEVAEKIPEVPFYSVDVEKFPPISKEFNIAGVPLILFLEEGKEIHRITGMATIASIEHATTVLRDK
jgi:thioredoxin 1|tara:strand:+ start:11916 stop:12227 length:312 start_codon:yes stop_codon:yes gene_type:complete